jgi:hypothetical protein
MKTIDYFKLQAKNLHRDFKTKTPSFFDKGIYDFIYEYTPKYFDINGIVCDFDLDEDNFSLMNAQHVIAQIVGFEKWSELLKASEAELELAKLLFDNQDKVDVQTWVDHMTNMEEMNQTTFDSESRLEIFKECCLKRQIFEDSFANYLLK